MWPAEANSTIHLPHLRRNSLHLFTKRRLFFRGQAPIGLDTLERALRKHQVIEDKERLQSWRPVRVGASSMVMRNPLRRKRPSQAGVPAFRPKFWKRSPIFCYFAVACDEK